MANETKMAAAAAVLEAMGGEVAAAEPQAAEAKVKKTKKAAKKAEPKVKATKKAKVVAPKRPGPKTVAVDFPANTSHKTADGGEIEIAKVRVSYLVKLPGGRLKWFSALKVKAMTESTSAVAAETEEVVEAAA